MIPAMRPGTLAEGSFPIRVATPQGLEPLEEGPYEVRFARDEADLEAVLRLRFEVFNRELGEGLGQSWATGLDRDAFDASCHHLLLVERAGGTVVGTYRLQTVEQARAGAGLYCATEFDLAPLESIVARAVELGRACIAREHRQGSALFALWRGLASYLSWSRKRFLFGCCSLTSQDPRAGLRLAADLARDGHDHPTLWCAARAEYACESTDGPLASAVPVPTLFGTYLRHGARVCSAPALDREFGTIDWLVRLDVADLPARLRRLFFAGLPDPLEARP